MGKKIIIFVFVFLVIGICLILFYGIDNKKEKVKSKCFPFTGGSFHIIFNTNGGENIPTMHVCIACNPESYDDLPIPVRDGYIFGGWYYDKDFKNKIEFTNTKDFRAIPIYDKNKCMTGYKDIEIYAKWS